MHVGSFLVAFLAVADVGSAGKGPAVLDSSGMGEHHATDVVAVCQCQRGLTAGTELGWTHVDVGTAANVIVVQRTVLKRGDSLLVAGHIAQSSKQGGETELASDHVVHGRSVHCGRTVALLIVVGAVIGMAETEIGLGQEQIVVVRSHRRGALRHG